MKAPRSNRRSKSRQSRQRKAFKVGFKALEAFLVAAWLDPTTQAQRRRSRAASIATATARRRSMQPLG
jgi:hypothetical protein